jgi:arsenate reductase-like glutaredoxin family protein
MAPKRAKYITYGNDERCLEIRKFVEDAGVVLDIRDIEKMPLSERELEGLLEHFDLNYFLNQASPSYKKHGWDKRMPERGEFVKSVIEDHTLLRRPIIRTARLMTVGCDKKKIAQMLQIPRDRNTDANEPKPPRQNRQHVFTPSSK